jgi:sugar transferase (PEP-CTERM/EpsH1 system associated)
VPDESELMRILYVTQIVPYPPHGGVLQRGFNLLRELGRRHEVHLLAFHHPDELPPGEPVERSRQHLGQFCRSLEYFPLWPKQSRAHKLAAFAAGAVHPRPFSVLAHRSAALARRIAEICNGPAQPDVVHLDTIALAPYLQHCGPVPAVLAHHNIESQLMARRADYESGLARWYVRAQAQRLVNFEREQAGRFPLNITVSTADSALLEKICPGVRTAAVPNGVDTDYFCPRPGEETPALIYTGGMNMFANRDAVEWFLDAIWPRIKAAVPEVKFFAIGQRPSPRVLAAAAADPAVEAPGFVDDVRPWVARSAVYVVPLRVGGGTRLKMVDAMAQGKAIVATTIGAEGIEGVDGEHFLLADEPEQFAQAVVRLLRDKQAMRKLGAAARKRAEERYAWPILGQRLAEHYERVIEDSRR